MCRDAGGRWRRALCGLAAAVGLTAGADPGPPPDPASRVVAVLPRRADVLASGPYGLYRALRSDRAWHRLPSPGPLPALHAYDFVATPEDSSAVLVYTRPANDDEAYRAEVLPGTGLYRSDDDGRSWAAVSRDYEFRSVFRHPDGPLYALVGPSAEGTWQRRVLTSRDGGTTWRDVTNNANDLGVGSMKSAFRDPDHPALVCLDARGKRGYVLQADDDRYLWRAMRDSEWLGRHATADDFLKPEFAYSAPDLSDYQCAATFGNYFLHPFGGRTALDAFTLTTDRARHDFPRVGPKVVRATLRFRPEGRSAALTDRGPLAEHWGLKVVDPEGRRSVVASAAEAAVTGGTEADRARFETRDGLRRVEVGPDTPYERDVDLSALFAFGGPGTYRVQLRYANPCRAGAGGGGWVGVVGGEPFSVEVR